MKYRINKTNYHEFNIYKINKLPSRSYFIPYPDREQADCVAGKDKRYRSPKVVCLNGDWDFRFYPHPADIPDILDTGSVSWDTIDVPSCWQFRGYDKPFYVNMRYQFPFNPPKIPQEDKVPRTFFWIGADRGIGPVWKDPGEEYNFAGVYRTFFDADDLSKRYVISFLGVASCADVYINGRFAGYTEGSHNTAEFYVSPYIREGANELVVVVHRWCTGSYLECQDMFRNNGIFRDVLLRIEEKNDIRDIDFRSRRTDAVRIRVMKSVPKYIADTSQQTDEYYLLKKFNWLIFKREDVLDTDKKPLFDINRERRMNNKLQRMLNYYDIRKLIEAIHPDLEAAWRLKDDVVDFYDDNTLDTAEEALNELIQKFYRSGIPEMIQFGKTLRNWKQEIINSFTVVGVRHKVDKETGQVVISELKLNTNISETKNSIIKTLKKSANGYACWHRFRNRCLYILRPNAKPVLNPLPPVKKVYR